MWMRNVRALAGAAPHEPGRLADLFEVLMSVYERGVWQGLEA